MPWTRRWLTVIGLIALALVAGGWGTVWFGQPYLYRRLAARQAVPLYSPDATLRREAANQLRGLGIYGIDPLVAALFDDNTEAADAAEQALDRALDDWRQLPPAVASQCVERLARRLASRIEQMPPERRFAASRWTQQMLVWPLESSAVNVPRVLADCEYLAAECAPLRIEQLLAAAPEPPVVADTRPAVAADKSTADESAEKAEEPSLEPTPPPSTDLTLVPPATAPLAAEPTPAPPAPRFSEPKRFLAPNAHKLAPPRPSRKSRPPDDAKPAAASDPYAWLREETDIGVMRLLHADDPRVVEAAQADLLRRGYRPRDMNLCRTLVHPDADQRRIFAQALPRIPGIDARPWLLQLTEDRDPEVRRIATAILRTSQDPEVQRRLK
jgi:hypothetical protein